MNSKSVKVAAAPDGSIVVPAKENPEYGSVRVEQTRTMIDEAGFLRRKKLVAFIPGTIADLQAEGFVNGQEIEGKIIVKESMSPFNKKNPAKDHKVAGETGIVCCVGEDPIYRKQVFTDNSKGEDQLIEHTNGAVIKEAWLKLNKTAIDKA